MKNFIKNSFFLVLLLVQPVYSQEERTSLNFADTIFILTAHAAFHVSLALAHELGHIITAQLFLKSGANIVEDSTQYTTNIPSAHEPINAATNYAPNVPRTALKNPSAITLFGEYPEFQSCWLNALVHLAGPLSGLAASYIALKATNIIQELNKQENLKKAFKKGIQKTTFNEDQPSGIRGLVFIHLLLNSFSLIPSSQYQFESEGEKIRQCFFKTK